MTEDQAQTAVAGSALVVGGIYAFRKLVESGVPAQPRKGGKLTDAIGFGPPPPVGTFVVGWGFTFLVLSLVAQVNANLGGSFAILVGTGAMLTNGSALAADVHDRLQGGDRTKLPETIGGVPVYDPTRETDAEYDKRFGDYLLEKTRRDAAARKNTQQSPNPLIPGNPLGGSPFPVNP